MRCGCLVLLCAVTVATSAVFAEPTRVDLELKLPGPHEGTLRLTITRDGKPLDSEFDRFLANVLSHFDRDQDGEWDVAETARVFAFPQTNGKSAIPMLVDVDTSRDRKIQLAELQAWCDRQQIHVLAAGAVQPAGVGGRLSKIFAAACDPDDNGRVERIELQAAPRRLLRYDLNDDEILDWKEMLAAAEVTLSKQLRLESERTTHVARRLILDLGEPGAIIDATDRSNKLFLSGSRFVLQAEDGTSVVSGKLERDLPGMNTVAEFLVAQLEEASAGDSALTKSTAAKEESLRGLLDLFSFADRNGDDRLTAMELRDYLALLTEGLRCQYVVRLHDRDQNWFSFLDVDGDLRLTPLELARLRELPLQSNGQPSRYLELEVGTVPATVWGGVRIPAPVRAKPKPKSIDKKSLPAWFVAQDRNADGVVSRREFLGPVARFRELDENSDELLEPVEAQ